MPVLHSHETHTVNSSYTPNFIHIVPISTVSSLNIMPLVKSMPMQMNELIDWIVYQKSS